MLIPEQISLSNEYLKNFVSGYQSTTNADLYIQVYAVKVAPSGSIYALINSVTSPYSKILLIKYNKKGSFVWQKQLNVGAAAQRINSAKPCYMGIDSNENIAISYTPIAYSGYTSGSAEIASYDKDGNYRWTYTFHNSTDATFANGCDLNASSFILSGTLPSETFIVCASNASGNSGFWGAKFSITSPIESYTTFDSSGNIYVTVTNSSGTTIAKLSSDLTSNSWQRFLPSIRIKRIKTDSSNNIYLVGHTYNSSSTASPIDGYIFKYNSSGTLLNNNKISHTSNKCSLWDVSLDAFGNIYTLVNYNFSSLSTTVNSFPVSGNQTKVAVIKLDSSFNLIMSNDFFHQESTGQLHGHGMDIGNRNTIYTGVDSYFFSNNNLESLALIKLNINQHNNRLFKMDRHSLGYTNSLNNSTSFTIASSGISETAGSLTFQAHPASNLTANTNSDYMVTSSYTNQKSYF